MTVLLGVSRRQVLNGVGTLVVLGASAPAVNLLASDDTLAASRVAPVPVQLSAAQITSISGLCDAIIPATDTGGALAAGVVGYISNLFARDSDTGRRAFTSDLDMLNAEIARRRRDEDLPKVMRAILKESDPAHPSPAARFLRALKRSALIGYYTSEIGASRELVYVPVPGPYQPDIPVTPDTRAFSNDLGALL